LNSAIPEKGKVGIVGAGMLGLTLAYRLAKLGFKVDIYEAAGSVGGLCRSYDCGAFIWDEFYHCIMPQDSYLIRLLDELGLRSEIEWKNTRTAYFRRGIFYSMSNALDYLRFPLLSFANKLRLAVFVFSLRRTKPKELQKGTAKEWILEKCGKDNYELFWQPMLVAKFGPYNDKISASLLCATIQRGFRARSKLTHKEQLGYVRGGYKVILSRLSKSLTDMGATIRLLTKAVGMDVLSDGGNPKKCRLSYTEGGQLASKVYDQVFFTGPTPGFKGTEDINPGTFDTGNSDRNAYLGAICLRLVLREPLTDYYLVNIGEDGVKLTGLVEMTNLINPQVETRGLSLVFLPRYLASNDRQFEAFDDELTRDLIQNGLRRLFPKFDEKTIVHSSIHRERQIQPLFFGGALPEDRPPVLKSPAQILNTSLITAGNLFNDIVVEFVDSFVQRNFS